MYLKNNNPPPHIMQKIISKQQMFARISKEITELYSLYDNIHIQYDPETQTHVIIIDKKYKFYLCSIYPFRPPQVFVGTEYYLSILKSNSEKFKYFLKRFTTCKCLCCNSLLHGNNWVPIISMNEIMNEIKSVEIIKEKVLFLILLDDIKVKFRIPEDIRFEEWF